jgi:DNA repair protein RecN (Recombination protein N)
LVRQRAALEAQKASLIVDERAYHQQLDLLRYQVNEITAAQLQPEEEEQLERDYGRARNAARLLELAQAARNLLGETENSVLAHAGAAARLLQEVRRIDPAAEPLPAELEQAITSLRELERELSRYCDRIELDPARLQSLEERLNLLNALKRKYGATVQEILAFGQQARSKLRQLEQRDTELSRLNEELRKIDSRLQQAGAELSDARRQAVPRFARAVSQQLADLGFRQAAFSVTIHRQENPLSAATVSPTGFDSVEFQFAPNPGEPARPLRAIASSGELARVMLGLKTVLAAEDQIPVLVFDEVDANIGGETAAIVGEKMRQVARRRQVFCITHLAPVAAAATAHFVVTKSVEDDRAVIAMRCLHEEDRVTELARMLGGQSDVARRHAAALMDSRTKS